MLLTPMRAMVLHILVRLGDVDRAEQALARLGEHDRHCAETRIATAVLRLAQNDPRAAAAALAPVLDGSTPVLQWVWLAHAFLLEAIARDTLGDAAAADRALERALDLAEPDGALLWFLLHPVPELLERHARHRTSHAALVAEILSLRAGQTPAPPAGPQPPLEPLSDSEIRVLRYLPTNLTAPELPASCLSRATPSRPTCATCTPSSAPIAGPRPSPAPATWACWHPLPPGANLDRATAASAPRLLLHRDCCPRRDR